MTIAKDKVVSINYTLKDSDGNVIDSSKDSNPLQYIHGNNQLIPGLETQLEGKEKGTKINAVVEPADAYGEYNEKLIIEVPRKQFDSSSPIEEGMKFQADTPMGPQIVTVKKVSEDTITIDGNHELAGKTLYFDVEIMDIRDATAEELAPQQGGCSSCGGSCGGDSCGCGDGGCSSEGGCGCH